MKPLAALLLASALLAAPVARAADPAAADVEAGRAIYLQGRLADGSPLQAQRLGSRVQGAQAACVQCHRRSGLGLVEGDQPIAPITGRALFGSARGVVTVMDPVRGKALNRSHEPYTEEAVAAAVRTGRHPDGHAMNEMMPRYALDDASMRALVAYLHTLSIKR